MRAETHSQHTTDGLRVLHVGKYYPPYRGGIETHLQTLCQELRGRVELEVLVANDKPYAEHGVVHGVAVSRLATPWTLAGAPISRGMVRQIRESRADVLHLHLPHPSAILAFLLSGFRGRVVLSYHSDIVRQRYLGKLFEPFLLRAIERADAIIAASPRMLESSDILRRYRDRCHVIPYGIETELYEFADPRTVEEIHGRYGRKIVLGVGRLIYYKGFEYLVDAMRSVPDGHLILVGDGRDRAQLEARAREIGIADRVTFLGKVSDVVPYYHAARVFVLPSIARSEAFGIVQIEALAAGTPVINTWLETGVPYVSLDGVTGLTVTPRDAPALASAINTILQRKDLHAAFSSAARERARNEFGVGVMTDRILALYHEVLGGARARGPIPAAAG